MTHIMWECKNHGMTEFSIPDKNGKSICMHCYKEAPGYACDCLWDFVPLRGPNPDCSDCQGNGVTKFTGTIVRF